MGRGLANFINKSLMKSCSEYLWLPKVKEEVARRVLVEHPTWNNCTSFTAKEIYSLLNELNCSFKRGAVRHLKIESISRICYASLKKKKIKKTATKNLFFCGKEALHGWCIHSQCLSYRDAAIMKRNIDELDKILHTHANECDSFFDYAC